MIDYKLLSQLRKYEMNTMLVITELTGVKINDSVIITSPKFVCVINNLYVQQCNEQCSRIIDFEAIQCLSVTGVTHHLNHSIH